MNGGVPPTLPGADWRITRRGYALNVQTELALRVHSTIGVVINEVFTDFFANKGIWLLTFEGY